VTRVAACSYGRQLNNLLASTAKVLNYDECKSWSDEELFEKNILAAT